MRSWMVFTLCLFAILPAAVSAQQTTPSAPPQAAFLTSSTGAQSSHTLVADHLVPGSTMDVVLFDPYGGQSVTQGQTDSSGGLKVAFQPPQGGWLTGLYRAVAGVPGGESVSATFSVSDGKPEVYAGPGSPSPDSAFVLTGTGFPADQSVNLVLSLAGGSGDRSFQVLTDASGSFTSFVWPEEYGFPFWSAGRYQLLAPTQGAGTTFWVQEHPGIAYLTIADPVSPEQYAAIDYAHYDVNRFLWTVYADASGRPLGQFLLGPSDNTGTAQAAVQFPDLPSGRYLLATPYDWGETAFTLIAPTVTPTLTPTTTPQPTQTATFSPTATRTPRPTPTRTAAASKRHKATPVPTRAHKPRPTATRTPSHRICRKHNKKRKLHCRFVWWV